MESKDFRNELSSGSISVHSRKALYALDYSVSAAIDMYEALLKDSEIRDAFISIKAVTDTTFRVDVSAQVDPSDEELAECYEAVTEFKDLVDDEDTII